MLGFPDSKTAMCMWCVFFLFVLSNTICLLEFRYDLWFHVWSSGSLCPTFLWKRVGCSNGNFQECHSTTGLWWTWFCLAWTCRSQFDLCCWVGERHGFEQGPWNGIPKVMHALFVQKSPKKLVKASWRVSCKGMIIIILIHPSINSNKWKVNFVPFGAGGQQGGHREAHSVLRCRGRRRCGSQHDLRCPVLRVTQRLLGHDCGQRTSHPTVTWNKGGP